MNRLQTAQNVDESKILYAMVNEIGHASTSNLLPLTSNDLSSSTILSNYRKSGQVITEPHVYDSILSLLLHFKSWFDFFNDEGNKNSYANLYREAGHDLYVEHDVIDLLSGSFEGGEISRSKYVDLKAVEAKIEANARKLKGALDGVVKSLGSAKDTVLAERGGGINVINGRYCISVLPSGMRNVGIVHSRSRTGNTVYVEPWEIVETGNEGRELEVEKERIIMRIYRDLTTAVISSSSSTSMNVSLLSKIDAALGKFRYMDARDGIIPTVGTDGVVDVKDCKHPLIKGARGNHVRIGGNADAGCKGNVGLVLTGPNAGGKTVVMKTFGLLALCVRDG
eukprot:CAMPEP_0118648446 /NCGR_PEP_ID=MMETSP0785-20121206/9161_1 /TAXON_ID=91992 /ORGANISM="Bolidomonas pacifica, Strain CCMP 1866" /LENGTH=337 /DNA_ID=CAMNT_0006540641 /DNA_START=391 /DNA_END=1400 /DNA_ORIENTATION=+